MDCFVCAQLGVETRAVAICQHCQVALCMQRLAQQQSFRPGGTDLAGCPHELPIADTSHRR